MALRSIRKVDDELLRKKSRVVEKIDEKILQIIDDMYDTLKKSDDGIGIAAPQIGILKRIIVIDLTSEGGELYKLINPVIIKQKGEQVCREGCLSVPGLLGDVVRPKEVVVEALDEKGNKIKIKGDELLAVVLCHEIDHLDGILFIDKAQELFDSEAEQENEE